LTDEKQLSKQQQIPLNQSINVRVLVKGASIRILVDNKEVYDDHNFFSIRYLKPREDGTFDAVDGLEPGIVMLIPFTSGRVGFRCDADERARISKCKVTPL
jgi:hypothetical protein